MDETNIIPKQRRNVRKRMTEKGEMEKRSLDIKEKGGDITLKGIMMISKARKETKRKKAMRSPGLLLPAFSVWLIFPQFSAPYPDI